MANGPTSGDSGRGAGSDAPTGLSYAFPMAFPVRPADDTREPLTPRKAAGLAGSDRSAEHHVANATRPK